MSTATDFERASVHNVEHRIRKGSVLSRVKVVAIATAKIARAVGARWLLDKDALVKQGFTSVELDYELKNVRLKHAIEKVASLELICETITKFKVFRKGDDKKKAKRLMVSFVAHTSDPPFPLLEHLLKVGEGEGVCTLIPLQAELFPTGVGAAASGGKRAQHGAIDKQLDELKKAGKLIRKGSQKTLPLAAAKLIDELAAAKKLIDEEDQRASRGPVAKRPATPSPLARKAAARRERARKKANGGGMPDVAVAAAAGERDPLLG